MVSERKLIKREVSVAGHCFHAATDALTRAEELGPEYAGWRTANVMCAVSMLMFALEADVNHLLQRLYENRPECTHKNSPTLEDAYWFTLRERIELFCRLIGESTPDFGTRPFQVVSTLKKIRDEIVHGKPYLAQQEVIDLTEKGEPPTTLPKSLMADWEQECTIPRANQHRDDMIEVHHRLIEMSGIQLGNPLEMTSVLSW